MNGVGMCPFFVSVVTTDKGGEGSGLCGSE